MWKKIEMGKQDVTIKELVCVHAELASFYVGTW